MSSTRTYEEVCHGIELYLHYIVFMPQDMTTIATSISESHMLRIMWPWQIGIL